MEKEYFVLYTPKDMDYAYSLINSEYSKNEIFNILKSEDNIKKQACLIKLIAVENYQEAFQLVSVLTGQHGPVREICSAKIFEFLNIAEYRKYFVGVEIIRILLDGLTDIIPTVARNISSIIKFLPERQIVKDSLIFRILILLNTPEDSIVASNHELIKKTFRLYWYLEALAEIAGSCKCDINFEKIISETFTHEDYTIREKTAKILSKVDGFEYYKNMLRNDKIPYVFYYLK